MGMREEDRKAKLRAFLTELATGEMSVAPEEELDRCYDRLEEIYHSPDSDKGHRHFYSDIYTSLVEIHKQNPENVGNLTSSLDYIRQQYKSRKADVNIRNNISKLYDHVALDGARITYINSRVQESVGKTEIARLHEKLASAENQRKDLEASIRKTQDELVTKMQAQQREYIAILGIFAAVVITFVANMVFDSSVLGNMANVSIYRLALTVLLIALFTVNVLYGLYYYINRIVKNEDETPIEPLIVANTTIAILILIEIALWSAGVVEIRNSKILLP